MDHSNINTESRKNKHLNFSECMVIEIRLKDGFSAYKIAKELGRPINTILNEIRRGTTTQIKQEVPVEVYLADTGEAIYKKNRSSSCRKFKLLECSEFIRYAIEKILNDSWSPDDCFGESLATGRFNRSKMVCTKTLYNYIDLGFLSVKNMDLPMKLRRNTKSTRVKKNKRKLGISISERPVDINNRTEFGHWEIDTVVGKKSKDDNVLVTLLERKTRYAMIIKTASNTAPAVTDSLNRVRSLFRDKFDQVFKSITGDNGSEFADLSNLEDETNTKIYFTHPYSSFEKGTNERHNGLIRRFIHKGESISDYSCDDIAIVEEWMNTLPRKILNYKTPEELFELHLDQIYSI